MTDDTLTCSHVEFCGQVLDSLFADVADATHQFRIDQVKQFHRFDMRIETLVSSKKRAFAELLTQRLKEQGEQREISVLHHSDKPMNVCTPTRQASMEVEMVPLSAIQGGLQSSGEPGSSIFQRSLTKSTVFQGPTSTQIARMYRVPDRTRRLLSDRRFMSSSRISSNIASRCVRTRVFAFSSALLIVLNALFIGIVSNDKITKVFNAWQKEGQLGVDDGLPEWASTAEVFFTIGFAVELLLRLTAEGGAFACGSERIWNALDVMLVTASLSELCMTWTGAGSTTVSSIRLLRLLRLLRTFRSVRILRFVGFFNKFRLLTIAVQNSVGSFFWACCMVFWILYLVSVVFLHGIADYVGSGKANPTHGVELQKYFGSLGRVLLTLFMCVTGGMDWNSPMNVLFHMHNSYGVL